MTKPKIIFTERSQQLVLEALGYTIDKNGYICKDGGLALSHCGETVHVSEFGGVSKHGIIKDNIFSISLLVEKQNKEEETETT